MEEKKIALLVNPSAGKGKSIRMAVKLEKMLRDLRLAASVFSASWPESFTGFTDIFLVGGDGTLNHFINRYPDCALPVSLFAGGSGNDFSWKLNGPVSLEESLAIAVHGKIVLVDAGICNGLYFINGVGIGFDGKVVKSMGRKRMLSAGHLAYLFTVLKEILFYSETLLRILTGETTRVERVFMISIANGSRYGGGFLVAPHAIINDGLLDMVTIGTLSLAARLKNLPLIEKGKHLHLSFISTIPCTSIRIESDQQIPAHLDGELLEANVYEISVLPGLFQFRSNRRHGYES